MLAHQSSFLRLIYLFLALLGLCCCTDFSLVVLSGGCSQVVVFRLLIVVASLVVELRLSVLRFSNPNTKDSKAVAPRLQTTGSIVVAHGLSCSKACGILQTRDRIRVFNPGRWSLYRSHQGSLKQHF